MCSYNIEQNNVLEGYFLKLAVYNHVIPAETMCHIQDPISSVFLSLNSAGRFRYIFLYDCRMPLG